LYAKEAFMEGDAKCGTLNLFTETGEKNDDTINGKRQIKGGRSQNTK